MYRRIRRLVTTIVCLSNAVIQLWAYHCTAIKLQRLDFTEVVHYSHDKPMTSKRKYRA